MLVRILGICSFITLPSLFFRLIVWTLECNMHGLKLSSRVWSSYNCNHDQVSILIETENRVPMRHNSFHSCLCQALPNGNFIKHTLLAEHMVKLVYPQKTIKHFKKALKISSKPYLGRRFHIYQNGLSLLVLIYEV